MSAAFAVVEALGVRVIEIEIEGLAHPVVYLRERSIAFVRSSLDEAHRSVAADFLLSSVASGGAR